MNGGPWDPTFAVSDCVWAGQQGGFQDLQKKRSSVVLVGVVVVGAAVVVTVGGAVLEWLRLSKSSRS